MKYRDAYQLFWAAETSLKGLTTFAVLGSAAAADSPLYRHSLTTPTLITHLTNHVWLRLRRAVSFCSERFLKPEGAESLLHGES
jgi:hypothetical protein